MDGVIENNGGQVPLVAEEVSMQIIEGQVYANTIQVTDGTSYQITLDPTQHNYSAPLPNGQFILHGTDQQVLHTAYQEEVVDDNGHNNDLCQENDEDEMKQDMSSLVNIKQEVEDVIASYFVNDPLTHSISHHDYTGTVPQILKQEVADSIQVADELQQTESGLVIEEAVEQEICTSQQMEEEEIIRSKPLTAMYLQRKEVGTSDSGFTSHPIGLVSPSKSPSSSNFTLRSSERDFSYDDVSDIGRMRLSYNDPISVYHPNTGEIHFTMDPEIEIESQRSVGAILAASEAIKHQDIASEVEVGTCDTEATVHKKGRKKKEKERRGGGIDDDIEQIRMAARNVAFTLMGMKDNTDGRKKRKPKIRLTLTKSKNRKITTDDDDFEYQTSSYKGKVGRKRKNYFADRSDNPNVIYQCEYCEKLFKTRAKVQTHTKIHTEERAFNCDICGGQFRRREHLVRHYRRHTNERPYQCLECGKSYMRAEHLKRHSYDHSGEKPFECPVCPKAFTRHDRLIKHSLVHDK